MRERDRAHLVASYAGDAGGVGVRASGAGHVQEGELGGNATSPP